MYSGSTRWDDCGRAYLDELCVSSFPWLVPTPCLSSLVSPSRLRSVKGVCVFICNLPRALFCRITGVFPLLGCPQGKRLSKNFPVQVSENEAPTPEWAISWLRLHASQFGVSVLFVISRSEESMVGNDQVHPCSLSITLYVPGVLVQLPETTYQLAFTSMQ